MTNASHDQNNEPTLIGVLQTDGQTVIPIQGDSVSHALKVDNDTTGTDHGPVNDIRDQNMVPVLLAVSNVDGKTPVTVYATSDGKLLINSS